MIIPPMPWQRKKIDPTWNCLQQGLWIKCNLVVIYWAKGRHLCIQYRQISATLAKIILVDKSMKGENSMCLMYHIYYRSNLQEIQNLLGVLGVLYTQIQTMFYWKMFPLPPFSHLIFHPCALQLLQNGPLPFPLFPPESGGPRGRGAGSVLDRGKDTPSSDPGTSHDPETL